MCQRVTCSSCGKPTFAGCGRHVEAVLGDVPRDRRCACRGQERTGARAETPTAAGGWLRSLFGPTPRGQP